MRRRDHPLGSRRRVFRSLVASPGSPGSPPLCPEPTTFVTDTEPSSLRTCPSLIETDLAPPPPSFDGYPPRPPDRRADGDESVRDYVDPMMMSESPPRDRALAATVLSIAITTHLVRSLAALVSADALEQREAGVEMSRILPLSSCESSCGLASGPRPC